MINFFWIIVASALLFLNAFFVAAEFGMVKLRHTRVEDIKGKHGLRGKILAQIHQSLDAYLSACQVGITLASLGLGWVGEPAFARLLEALFLFVGVVSAEITRIIAFATAFSLISFLHIVLGELMPKSLAIRQPERISLWTALPLYSFYWLMYPIIFFLNACSNFFLRRAGLAETPQQETFYSTEEIKLILNASHFHGELTEEETEIIERTLDFADLKVTEVMRSTQEMIFLETHQSIKKNLDIIFEHKYSRYPVFDKKIHQFTGIIHVKDLFTALYEKKAIINLKPFMRPVLKVSSHLPALDLLRKFRAGMPHFALVYEKRKELIGFITLDNLLHILVGRIKDEFHKTRDDWINNKDGTLSIKGECSIYTLERALDMDILLDENEEDTIDTISDLILMRLKKPQKGERIFFNSFDLEIEKMNKKEILKVKVYPKFPSA